MCCGVGTPLLTAAHSSSTRSSSLVHRFGCGGLLFSTERDALLPRLGLEDMYGVHALSVLFFVFQVRLPHPRGASTALELQLNAGGFSRRRRRLASRLAQPSQQQSVDVQERRCSVSSWWPSSAFPC